MANAVKTTKSFRDAIGKQFRGGFIIERADAMTDGDEESRIVELSFASNQPIPHWFGYLELDMSSKSVRLDRLNRGGALLWNHRSENQIGVVREVTLTKEKARAKCEFSGSQMGEENYNDVVRGIKQNVSVGFIPYTIEQKVDKDGKQIFENGEPVYISRDWEPFEISLVSIPADISVGVGRSLENFEEQRNMPEETTTIPAEQPAVVPPVQIQRAETNPTLERIDHFIAIGERFGQVELARQMATVQANTEADLIRAIGEAIPNTQITPPVNPEVAAQRQGQQIQLATSTYRGKLKSFKGSDAQEKAYRAGMWLLAIAGRSENAVKFCRDNGIILKRTQTGTNDAYGGFLVPDEFENVMIDLRILYGVFRANANVVPMTTDTKSRPRRTGGLTAYPIGAGGSYTKSTATWDLIKLAAKKWGVLAKYEDELSEDSVINTADTLASEIAYAFTYAEDNAGFNGDGSGTYHGIVGLLTKLAGATAGLVTGSGNLWSELTLNDHIYVVGKLPQYARKSGNVKWYCSHTYWANVMQKLALAAGGVTHAEIEGELRPVFLGRPVEIVEVMPTAEANSQIPVVYGNMAQSSMMGDRRGVTIKMTDSNDTDFEEDLMSIKGSERFDINNHDVGNTSVPGPMVGLITAAS